MGKQSTEMLQLKKHCEEYQKEIQEKALVRIKQDAQIEQFEKQLYEYREKHSRLADELNMKNLQLSQAEEKLKKILGERSLEEINQT